MLLRWTLLTGIFHTCFTQENADRCLLKYDAGPCRAEKFVVKFDSESGSCVPAVYGGCRGNANRFSGITECEEVCKQHVKVKFSAANPRCSQPPLLSDKSCMGIFPRFTFNPSSGSCDPYMYGGCNGSENLYISETECIKSCIKPDAPVPDTWSRAGTDDSITFPENDSDESDEESEEDSDVDICRLPPVLPGTMACLAFIPKWTFSTSEGKCTKYIYGGCRGTKNLFSTEAECTAACGTGTSGRSADVCQLPIKPGPCRGFKESFGFNSNTGRCEQFIYGGCQGNANIFPSLEDCVNTCGGGIPDTKINCDQANCDMNEQALHAAKGCVPITKPGECCPSSWDCSTWTKRLATKDQCFAASELHPMGKFYNPGEEIDLPHEDSCTQACSCHDSSSGQVEIVCAEVDCGFPPVDRMKCKAQYKGIMSCCPDSWVCDDDMEKLGECVVDSKTYKYGEKIYPRKDPCLICLCKEGWDGSLKEPFCSRADCGLFRNPKLARGCQPIYRDDVCCPIEWVCPEENQVEVPRSASLFLTTESALKNSDRCLIPPSGGECSDLSFLYYFDKSSGSCQQFEGCRGDGNSFNSEDECNSACREFVSQNNVGGTKEEKKIFPAKSPDCEEEVAIGRCRSRLKKYYYDITTGKCEQFFYSGCQGGKNMFDDLRDCVIKCVSPSSMLRGRTPPPPPDAAVNSCSLDKAVGPCRAMKPRFFFNKKTGNCESFMYSGCQGNANNFPDLKSCQDRCQSRRSGPFIQVGGASTLPAMISPPGSPPLPPAPPMPGMVCAGCPQSAPIDDKVKKVAAEAVSKLTLLTGVTGTQCDHLQLLEILDVKRQIVAGTNYILKMRMRTKSGENCDAVESRVCSNIYAFEPLPFSCSGDGCIEIIREQDIICEDTSSVASARSVMSPPGVNAVQEDPCLMPKKIGKCKAAIIRFYFDQDTSSCKQFIFGGCGANGNNFVSAAECEEVCSGHLGQQRSPVRSRTALGDPVTRAQPTNPICNKPMDAGPCMAIKPRFFYNAASRRCEEFLYGGCRGNENNFVSLGECVSACGKQLRGRPSLPVLQPKCTFGNRTYAVGDVVRFDNNPCKACVCSSPPDLSCSIKKCPSIAPARPGCRIVMDDLGCCPADLDCPDQLTPGMIGGGAPPGGLFGSSRDPESKKIAAQVTRSLLAEVPEVTGAQCQDLTLLEVLEAQKQVVAGTNYKLSLRLRVKQGPLCQDELVRVCRNIWVHKPLPFQCQDSSSCLQLMKQNEMECS